MGVGFRDLVVDVGIVSVGGMIDVEAVVVIEGWDSASVESGLQVGE